MVSHGQSLLPAVFASPRVIAATKTKAKIFFFMIFLI
jgi:hypothetical protein